MIYPLLECDSRIRNDASNWREVIVAIDDKVLISMLDQMEGELITIANANLFLLFHILFQKKLINYAEFQEAISVARECFPDMEFLKEHFDRLERTYQPGRY